MTRLKRIADLYFQIKRFIFKPDNYDERVREFASGLRSCLPLKNSRVMSYSLRINKEDNRSVFIFFSSHNCAIDINSINLATEYFMPMQNIIVRLLIRMILFFLYNKFVLIFKKVPLIFIEDFNFNLLPKPEIIMESESQFQCISLSSEKILHVHKPGKDKEVFLRDFNMRKSIHERLNKINVPAVIVYDLNKGIFVTRFINGRKAGPLNTMRKDQLKDMLQQLTLIYRFIGKLEAYEYHKYYEDTKSKIQNALSTFTVFSDRIDFSVLDGLYENLMAGLKNKNTYCVTSSIMHGDLYLGNNVIISKRGEVFLIDWGDISNANIFYDVIYMLIFDYFTNGANQGDSSIREFKKGKGLFELYALILQENLNLKFSKEEIPIYLLISIMEMIFKRMRKKNKVIFKQEDMFVEPWKYFYLIERLFGLEGLIKKGESKIVEKRAA